MSGFSTTNAVKTKTRNGLDRHLCDVIGLQKHRRIAKVYCKVNQISEMISDSEADEAVTGSGLSAIRCSWESTRRKCTTYDLFPSTRPKESQRLHGNR